LALIRATPNEQNRNGPTTAKIIAPYPSTKTVRFQSLLRMEELGFEIFSGKRVDRGFKKKYRR
jgi:hypothetical protein